MAIFRSGPPFFKGIAPDSAAQMQNYLRSMQEALEYANSLIEAKIKAQSGETADLAKRISALEKAAETKE